VRVLLTGSCVYYALAACRALDRAGHVVTVADSTPRAAGFFSRHAAARWRYPSIARDPDAFVDAVVAYLGAHPHDVIVPLYEEALVLSRHVERIAPLARLALPDYATMMTVHDKSRLGALAAGHGVPTPRTVVVDGPAPVDFPYPALVKVPQSSCARGVATIDGPAGFGAAWADLARRHQLPPGVPALLQQRIDGVQHCTLTLAQRGQVKGTLVYRNLAELPPGGGAGAARVSVRHPAIERHVEALVAATGWHGVVGFDFLVERGSGRALLIDGNPRFTPGTLLADLCGLDVLGGLLALAERELPRVRSLRAGVVTRAEPVLAVWLLGKLAPGRGFAARAREAAAVLRASSGATSDCLRLDDPLTWMAVPAAMIDVAAVALGLRPVDSLVDHACWADYAPPDAPRAARAG
jgi:predicted ATP-grasp superfamily ATP-dependent carboligase